MLANLILTVLSGLLSLVTIPIALVTTFVGGILVSLTFGMLLIPMSAAWVALFLGPLLWLSWLWEKAPLLRLPIAVIGIPIALAGQTYVSCMPSMGEFRSRAAKLQLVWTWPFSRDCLRYQLGKLQPEEDYERWRRFQDVLTHIPRSLRNLTEITDVT